MKVFILLTLIGCAFYPCTAQNTPKWESMLAHIPDQEPIPQNLAEITGTISYPHEVLGAGIEGLVQVMVQVDSLGNYMSHYVARSAHPLLTEAVEVYLPHLRFTPAIKGEVPVCGWKALPFRFSIRRFSPNYHTKGSNRHIYPDRRKSIPQTVAAQ
ncbi:MAG: energy transducer TonB [Bacteroidota bacterium]